jgi:hypothetical protein
VEGGKRRNTVFIWTLVHRIRQQQPAVRNKTPKDYWGAPIEDTKMENCLSEAKFTSAEGRAGAQA